MYRKYVTQTDRAFSILVIKSYGHSLGYGQPCKNVLTSRLVIMQSLVAGHHPILWA